MRVQGGKAEPSSLLFAGFMNYRGCYNSLSYWPNYFANFLVGFVKIKKQKVHLNWSWEGL